MAEMKYVSPENLEAVETELKTWIIDKIKTAVDQLVNGAPEALDTLKEISDYISSHTDEYNALIALVGDKASKTDLAALQGAVTSLQSQIDDASHSHNNKAILDATTASFTTALLAKLNGLTNYDDSDLNAKVGALEEKAHSHTNEIVLNETTASYTIEEQNKLKNIEAGANKTTVDTSLKTTSSNPIQNKVVATKFEEQNNAIETLQRDVENLAGSLKPMTSEEIDEMFDRVFNDA